SFRLGSFKGTSGRRLSRPMKTAVQIPPTATSETALSAISIHGIRGSAGSLEAGITSQTKSTQSMTRINSDTRMSDRGFRLFSRINSRKNGRKNWHAIKASATHSQPPRVRRTYQGISSLKFPAHIIRYWLNDVYAHNITKASSRFPRSLSRPGVVISDIGLD